MFDLLLWFTTFSKKTQEANIYKIKSRRIRWQKIVGTQKVDIGSWEDLLRAVFINEDYRNLKVVIADGELTRNSNHQIKEEVRHFTWQMHCRDEYCESIGLAWLFLWLGFFCG